MIDFSFTFPKVDNSTMSVETVLLISLLITGEHQSNSFIKFQVHGFVQDDRTGEKVAMLVGKWDEAMYYVLGDPTTKPKGYDPMTEAVLLWERDKYVTKTRYNFSPFAITLNELTSGLSEKLPPTDSRLRPDQRHLENGEYELGNAEKLRLEQLQRQVFTFTSSAVYVGGVYVFTSCGFLPVLQYLLIFSKFFSQS